MLTKKFLSVPSIVFVLALLTSTTNADNSWGPYHWAQTANPFDLIVVNSTTGDWDGFVAQSIMDWSTPLAPWSTYLTMVEDITGVTDKKTRRRCKGPSGQLRICNYAYGPNGWLGIAGISVDANNHITTGYTKLNDTYFAREFYNDAWRQSVTCQELGHNVGLGHQDIDFNNAALETCMDYQNPPWPSPDEHDFEQLDTIYGHADSYNSYSSGDGGGGGGGGDDGCKAPPGKGCNKSGVGNNNGDIGWGMSLGRRGQQETFIRIDANGTRHITHVIWAIGH